jgi:hypothetical protein
MVVVMVDDDHAAVMVVIRLRLSGERTEDREHGDGTECGDTLHR